MKQAWLCILALAFFILMLYLTPESRPFRPGVGDTHDEIRRVEIRTINSETK